MKSKFQKLGMLLMLMCSSWGIAFAQYDVSGKVTNAGGEPLTGVTVAVKNTNNGTTTDVDGMYTLNISGSSATIVFSYVGFRSQEKQVNGANSSLNISLEETSSELDEVVVSGLATTVKRKNAANNVASISSKDLTGITPQSTFDGALSGKFTGAQISSNSGAPGGGMTFRLRGVTSINAPAQPLFIIDGVYVDNSSIAAGLNVVSDAAGGGSTAQYDQDNPSNRIADIDPGDIENVEILKGASAAALYGSRAAGGVVIITTKKGKQSKGGANISFTQSLGVNTISHPLGLREWDPTKVESYYGPDEVAVYNAAVADGQYYNYEDELYGNTGFVSDSRLSVGGGNERTTFYTSMSHRNEDGIVNNTGYTKTGLRLNVTHQVNKRIDVSLYNNFLRTSADRGFFNNDNTSTTMGISYAATPPWAELHPDAEGNYPNNNYSASNFLQTSALITNNELTNRYIGGASATIKLLTNDQHSLKLV
ncbi:MAG: carboxypeptidase-like regulatory domain-containing protein, partial [Chitinophagales bacterium]|nr:carboxypeptidase-like regulatory domain-containing protein [Chitinophagales bacterium]